MGAQPMTQAAPAAVAMRTPEQNAGITRSYIPNPVLGVENSIAPATAGRSAQIDAVLRQADLAEAQAQKYL